LTLKGATTHFSDGTGYQPTNDTHDNSVELRGAITPSLEGIVSFSESKTKVAFRALPEESQVGHAIKEKTARVDIQGTIREDLAIRAYLVNSDVTRDFSRSGYAKKVNTAGLRLAWAGVPNLFVRAGLESRDIDYLTSKRAATLNPKVETAWVTARYRPL